MFKTPDAGNKTVNFTTIEMAKCVEKNVCEVGVLTDQENMCAEIECEQKDNVAACTCVIFSADVKKLQSVKQEINATSLCANGVSESCEDFTIDQVKAVCAVVFVSLV